MKAAIQRAIAQARVAVADVIHSIAFRVGRVQYEHHPFRDVDALGGDPSAIRDANAANTNRRFRVARYGRCHHHATIMIVPTNGDRSGAIWTCRSVSGFSYSTGKRQVQLDLAGAEASEIVRFAGPGWPNRKFNMTITWEMPGRAASTDVFTDLEIKDLLIRSQMGRVVTASLRATFNKSEIGEVPSADPKGIPDAHRVVPVAPLATQDVVDLVIAGQTNAARATTAVATT